jgi:hypothetical protein
MGHPVHVEHLQCNVTEVSAALPNDFFRNVAQQIFP